MTNDIIIFDKTAQKIKQARIKKEFKNYDFLHQFASKDLNERLSFINRKFENIFNLENALNNEEILTFDNNIYDQIISTLALHNTNDLIGVLKQIQNNLKPDGLFIACLFGGETLYELRECLQQAEMEITSGITPRIHPFADKQDIGALMQRTGFALPVIDSERVIVTYDNIFKLMHDLRGMGESNILIERQKSFTRREIFTRADEIYKEKYSGKDERLEATFEIIFTLGWTPHESQQKPLKPGSAKVRMADALNAEEVKC